MKIGFVVLNYINFHDTIKCIESLCLKLNESLREKADQSHIFIIDNKSPNESWEELNYAIKKISHDNITIHTYLSKTNLGFGGGNNIGLEILFNQMKCDFVFIVNNDTTIQKIALSDLSIMLKENGPICIGANIQERGNGDKLMYGGARFLPWSFQSKPVFFKSIFPCGAKLKFFYISGAFMGFNRRLYEMTGGFKTNYFLYFEELEMFYRAKKISGEWLPVRVLDSWKINHSLGGSTGNTKNRAAKSPVSEFYSARARLLFAHDHLITFLPIALIYNFLLILDRCRHGNFISVKSIFFGSVDGILRKTGINPKISTY